MEADSTVFIEFMLDAIKTAYQNSLTEQDRITEQLKQLDNLKVELAEKAIDKDNSPTIDYSNPDEVFKAMIVDNGEILNLKTELELAIKY